MSEARLIAALDHVLELTVLLHDDMTETLAEDGLTTSRAHLLWELRQRGPSTQSALADALKVSPRNVTGLVDALVEGGFVTREPHPTDRRAVLVALTEHGIAVGKAMEQDQRELAELLFAGMPARQFDCFATGLAAVVDRLRRRLSEVR
ncbi:MAG: MarR family transcriptional regulator [Jiangellaceae bacterium]|nr:MarR family transcriptional regulator [Jiangellaceae bacterium]